jgi:AraC-like DNA-binding protein
LPKDAVALRRDLERALRTLLRVCLEEISVARRLIKQNSSIEREVIAEIQYRRGLPPGDPRRDPLDDPVELINYFIESKHGNVQMRARVIAAEAGIEQRTLERNFLARYGKNVRARQVEVRLEFALSLLGFFPEKQIGKIAKSLGYTEVRDFNRFFRDHMHMSPTEWCRRDQELTERTMHQLARKRKPRVE